MGRAGEVLYAERSSGAWLRTAAGDRRIAASDESNTLWIGGRGEHAANAVRHAMLLQRWYIWQFSSSIAYPYVAAGRISGLVHFAQHLSSVHTAAGCFVAEEAGAVVTGLDGRPWDMEARSYILAATPALHEELRDLVEKSRQAL